PLVVQDLDQTHASRELIDAFRASQTFRIVPWPADREAEAALSSNVARAVLIIPPRSGRDVARGFDSPVQLLVDGSDANAARLPTGYAAGVGRNMGGRRPASGGAEIRPAIRLWYNPGLSSKRFYGPGIFVLVLSMFPPLLATLAMAREGEVKTILQVYASNIRAHEFLLGKMFAFVLVALAECLVLVAPLYLYFGVRLVGDPSPLLVATLCYAFCVAAFGTLVGAAIPNQMAALQAVMFGGFLLVFMLSGLLFPISNIPDSLRWLSNFVWGR